jgi:hypothetical protein
VNLLCASKPEYNAKFSVLAEMAPVFFAQNVQQTYLRLGALMRADEVLADSKLERMGSQSPCKGFAARAP